MTEYTRGQLIDAWDAIDRMDAGNYSTGSYYSDLAAIKAILPERPVQNMEELGWDQERDLLMEADYFGTKVVMFGCSLDEHVIITDRNYIASRHLTPTGRRYKFVLDDEHPEYLETEQDYKCAPENTVAIDPDSLAPWMKDGGVWKVFTWAVGSEEMAGTRRRVLRWGRGTDD